MNFKCYISFYDLDMKSYDDDFLLTADSWSEALILAYVSAVDYMSEYGNVAMSSFNVVDYSK